MKIILLLSASLMLAACVERSTTQPESDSEPVESSQAVTESSGALDSQPTSQTDAAKPAEKMSNQAQNIPAACQAQNTPRMANGAPCSDSFYADFHADVCGEWRQQCCSFKGVCS